MCFKDSRNGNVTTLDAAESAPRPAAASTYPTSSGAQAPRIVSDANRSVLSPMQQRSGDPDPVGTQQIMAPGAGPDDGRGVDLGQNRSSKDGGVTRGFTVLGVGREKILRPDEMEGGKKMGKFERFMRTKPVEPKGSGMLWDSGGMGGA